MTIKKIFEIREAAEICGVEEKIIFEYIEQQWIMPCDPESCQLDHEDLARLRLIRDLMNEFEVNEHAVPIILNLLDQLHSLRGKIRSVSDTDEE